MFLEILECTQKVFNQYFKMKPIIVYTKKSWSLYGGTIRVIIFIKKYEKTIVIKFLL